jgi:hypothetical protein
MKYKVLAASVTGLNGQVFKEGDVVDADRFVANNVTALVTAGVLSAYSEPVETPTEAEPTTNKKK